MGERLPTVTAGIPRQLQPIDDGLERRAKQLLAQVEKRRLVARFSGQIVLGFGSLDNRLTTPEARSLRHRIVVVLNLCGFTDTEIGRVLGMDRRSIDYILSSPAPRRTA